MTKTIQQLWDGEKPSEDTLNLVDNLIHSFQYPIGRRIRIREIVVRIRDAGHAAKVKIDLRAENLTLHLLKKKAALQEDLPSYERVQMLIPYWYAQRWLPPFKDYSDLPPLEKRPEPKDYHSSLEETKIYLEGRKPPKETISYVNFVLRALTKPMEGDTVFLHGGGKITYSMSPVEKITRYIQATGAKLGKELWGLEYAQTSQEADRIYEESIGLMWYWTLKQWITFPKPSELQIS